MSLRVRHTIGDDGESSGGCSTSTGSFSRRAQATTGICPSRLIATFTHTPPPRSSYVMGGVSVQPPARSARMGQLARTQVPSGGAAERRKDRAHL